MGLEERSKYEGFHSHQLDEDVERWTRSVLQRVTNCIADHSSLMTVRTLSAELAGMRCVSSLHQQNQHVNA